MDLATIGFGREIFGPEHEAYRENARRFMRNAVEPNIVEWEKAGFFPAELFREAAKAGLLCAPIPEQYGGGGGDIRHFYILAEEHGYNPAAVALEGGLLTDFTALAINAVGTEDQKHEWIPVFASGEGIGEIGLSEPGAGSDASAVTTYAVRDGDDYIINGQKSWITNAPIMTVILVAARTRPKGERDGLSLFIVPMDSPGITRSETDLMMKSAGGVGDIFFDNVRVPARFLLGGDEGQGLSQALSLINIGRIGLSCRAVATCETALGMTLDYVRTRKAFGQAIFDFQNTKFKLASVDTEIAAARAFVDQGIRANWEGRMRPGDDARLKLYTTEMQSRVLDELLQFFGGMGVTNDLMISKMYTLSRIQKIYAGTSEMMRMIISRHLP